MVWGGGSVSGLCSWGFWYSLDLLGGLECMIGVLRYAAPGGNLLGLIMCLCLILLALHYSLGPSVIHPWDDPACASWDSMLSGVFCHVPLPLGAHVWLESSVSCHGLTYTLGLCVDYGR